MARIGQNPNRLNKVPGWPSVMAAVITHLPDESGYHTQRMEVIRTCLTSLRKNAHTSLPVLVWDNGSCDRLRNWLQEIYRPDYLMLSPNVGKATARCSIYHMLPADTLVVFSDDDIFYYPGWVKPHLEIMNTFPNVGAVSGYPVRSQFNWGCENTIAWAEKNGKVTKGRNLIPDEWDKEFMANLGRSQAQHDHVTRNTIEVKVEYNGIEAYCTAHHCQFMCRAGTLAGFSQYDGYAMGDEKPFDNAIDRQGFLRLTTIQRYCKHIGNVMDMKIKKEAVKMGVWVNGK